MTSLPDFIPRQRSVRCIGPHGLHRMAYVEWGDPANPRVLVCVHGLTRVSRDFDFLARALAAEYRVVCPDVPGRGGSDWLPVPDDYGFPLYVADMVTLLARLDVDQVDWVGTSMGGLIGMVLACQPESPIRRLVLNDVGPAIAPGAVERLLQYVGKAPVFVDEDAAEAYIRQVSAPFGALSDGKWRHLTEHAIRPAEGGGWRMHYDPSIAVPFQKNPVPENADLWPVYDAIRCPTLVLRGEQSDLLLRETALEMTQRGPKARLAEIPGVGHAPMLLDEPQIGIVAGFLREG